VNATRRRRWRRVWIGLAIVLAASSAWITFANTVARAFEDDTPSRSIGTPANGRLEHGKRLPDAGPNFVAYSRTGTSLGRNTVHGQVREAVLDAYAQLARTHPHLHFVYGETGLPEGGPMPPHRTHQNGLSVDFLVPVRDAAGAVAVLPTTAAHKFGYAHEFDDAGRAGELRIDSEAIAAHLLALDAAARRHGLRIERVIFEPSLHAALFAAPGGKELRRRVPFMAHGAWIRHDEHYHVDFAPVPARGQEQDPEKQRS
jgi:penicillin-insensitive murein endopeptidase